MPVTAAAAAALCMSAMVSERSDSEDVDEAVEDPVEDEMEERWAATADLDDDEDGGEAFENTWKGNRAFSSDFQFGRRINTGNLFYIQMQSLLWCVK